jgi:hypothetical protein
MTTLIARLYCLELKDDTKIMAKGDFEGSTQGLLRISSN